MCIFYGINTVLNALYLALKKSPVSELHHSLKHLLTLSDVRKMSERKTLQKCWWNPEKCLERETVLRFLLLTGHCLEGNKVTKMNLLFIWIHHTSAMTGKNPVSGHYTHNVCGKDQLYKGLLQQMVHFDPFYRFMGFESSYFFLYNSYILSHYLQTAKGWFVGRTTDLRGHFQHSILKRFLANMMLLLRFKWLCNIEQGD